MKKTAILLSIIAFSNFLAAQPAMDTSTEYTGDISDLIGVNISWFNTWNESQPLANVALSARSISNEIPVDKNGNPISDFSLVLYEGSDPGEIGGAGGGAQYGIHYGKFTGKADLSADGGRVSEYSWNSESNTSTFIFTTYSPTNSIIHFRNTRKTKDSPMNSGLTNLQIMRPGHSFGDLLNTKFTAAMAPFSAFRVGQNWDDFTYSVTPPKWENRAKPTGIFNPVSHNDGLAPWEILVSIANNLKKDMWICLPPHASEDYIKKIFQTIYFGSDGNNPYQQKVADPVWPPLAPDRKLYFEVGNEIWNWSAPYGSITSYMRDQALSLVAAGDPNHYEYAPSEGNEMTLLRRHYAFLTVSYSTICRSVVGDSNMMSQFRPVISGQSGWSFVGEISLSYINSVYGGHDWSASWTNGTFPGKYIKDKLKIDENGTSTNEFGNVSHPITYWIYGYAVAPYLNGNSVNDLMKTLNKDNFGGPSVKEEMLTAITVANDCGLVPLAYEGGIERYNSYTEQGLDTVIEQQLNYWYSHGGKLFMYYAFAGNSGSGIYPDMTKQDPEKFPKIKAIRNIAGME